MLVSEFFKSEKITMEHLVDITGESAYWDTAGTFVIDNWDREIESMSPKQAKWLNDIQEEMTERRIKGKL